MPEKPSASLKPATLLRFAKGLAKESGELLLKMQARAKVKTYKGSEGDFALDADIKSENHLLKRIRERYPNHAILTEESGKHDKKSEYLWILDPLDGTVNYAHKLPFWAVIIAVWHKNKPLAGVIYAPALDEFFYASRGGGAFLNGKRIHVTTTRDIRKLLLAGNLKQFEGLGIHHTHTRYLSCTGIELAYVVCGRFAARLKLRGRDPFGYGAGALLVTEAGGKITDPSGKPWTLESDGVIASNSAVHRTLLNLVKKKL